MRIAFTGACGVLGRAAVTEFQHRLDAEVTSIDVVSGPGVINCDIRDTAQLAKHFQGHDVVVHAAAALPSYSEEQIWSVDVQGTESVLQAAAAANVPRIVHVSSTAVYGLPKQTPAGEDYPRCGVDPYSKAKVAAEERVEVYASYFEGTTIVRPKTFLGPGRLGIFAMLFEWAAEGRDFPVLGSGSNRAQMLHVSDLCSALVTILQQPASEVPGPYNLGATRFGTIAEDFQSVLDAAGHGGRVRRMPMAPAVLALKTASAIGSSPVYPRLIGKLQADSFVDTTRAEMELDFAPTFSNSELLIDTLTWWLNSATARHATAGHAHTQPWKQGILRCAKPLFA